MYEMGKIEDLGLQEPIIYAKLEENYLTSAGYIAIRDPKRHITKVEVYMREGRAGNYERCNRKSKDADFFDTNSNRQFLSRRRKNSSDGEYNVKNQKKDRNVTSNLIHHLVKYLTSSDTIPYYVKRIIEEKGLSMTFQDFQSSLLFQSKNLKTYVTVKHIKELWFSQNPNKKQFCTLMRILSKNFLCKHGFLSIYFSNKFNRNSKITHYKGLRSLLQVLSKKNFDTLKIYTSISNSAY